jgi:hypothetical protein
MKTVLHSLTGICCRITLYEPAVNSTLETHGESSSIFQQIDQLENFIDQLVAG